MLRDPKGSETRSKMIRGCISVMATFKFSYFRVIEGIMFVENNRGTPIIVEFLRLFLTKPY